jgi:hypothetical protein
MIEIIKLERAKDLMPPIKENEIFKSEFTLNKAENSYLVNIKRYNQVINSIEDVIFQMSFEQMEKMLENIKAEKEFSTKKVDTSYLP